MILLFTASAREAIDGPYFRRGSWIIEAMNFWLPLLRPLVPGPKILQPLMIDQCNSGQIFFNSARPPWRSLAAEDRVHFDSLANVGRPDSNLAIICRRLFRPFRSRLSERVPRSTDQSKGQQQHLIKSESKRPEDALVECGRKRMPRAEEKIADEGATTFFFWLRR